MPGWQYDAAATLDFGGAWVTVGVTPGRDPTSANLTVALNGVIIDSTEFALSRHPDSEGVYNLVFSTEYWARPFATGNPTVSFAAGTFVSPTLGPLDAFSEPVRLVDCRLPIVARASLLQTSGYVCAVGASTCPSDGIWRAAFVLEIVFSEPVFRGDGSPVTDADLQIYTMGGVAAVTGTYVVQISGGARRRRLSEAVGTTTLSLAVELGSPGNGLEKVQIRAITGAVRDGSGSWLLSHGDMDVVTAAGDVLKSYSARLTSSESAFPIVGVFVPVGITGAVVLVMLAFCLCCRRHRRNKVKVQVGPRWSTLGARICGSAANLVTPKPQPKQRRDKVAPKPQPNRPRGKAAPADALAIAKHYEWLRAKEPYVELTGRSIDTLADAAVDTLRGAQPACALPPGVLKTAHVVHSNLWGGVAPDDLEALRALGKLLRDGPSPLPESLVMAAASLDTSAAAATQTFGEAEATIALQRVIASGRAVPKVVALVLADVVEPPASIGYSDEADSKLKEQLATLLQQREWYAYALSAVRGLIPDCLAAFTSAGLEHPPAATDTDAVALVLEIIEMHARLGARQREAETRTHRAVETPYQAWVRARRCGGFSDQEAPLASKEVAQVRMQCNNEPQHREGGL